MQIYILMTWKGTHALMYTYGICIWDAQHNFVCCWNITYVLRPEFPEIGTVSKSKRMIIWFNDTTKSSWRLKTTRSCWKRTDIRGSMTSLTSHAQFLKYYVPTFILKFASSEIFLFFLFIIIQNLLHNTNRQTIRLSYRLAHIL